MEQAALMIACPALLPPQCSQPFARS